jgi:hypothetical protein
LLGYFHFQIFSCPVVLHVSFVFVHANNFSQAS